MVCVLYDNFRSTRFELRGFHQFFVFGSAVDHEIQTRELVGKVTRFDYSVSSRCLVRIGYV